VGLCLKSEIGLSFLHVWHSLRPAGVCACISTVQNVAAYSIAYFERDDVVGADSELAPLT
jgi:hypothetical protein